MTTITVTSKGQTTIPVAIRRKLGLTESGGELQIYFNESSGELVISKLPSISELSARISAHIKPGTRPLLNVDEFYQQQRKTDS